MEKISQKKLNPVVHHGADTFAQRMKRTFVVEKLYNKTGFFIALAVAIVIATGVSSSGVVFGVLLIIAVGALPLLYSIVKYPKFGMILLIVMAYMLFVLIQIGVDGPIGTLMDGLQVFLLVGILVRAKRDNDWSIFKSPITTVIFIWLAYNMLEFGNPAATSRLAWVYTVRSVAIVSFCYFVFMYNIRSVKYIRLIFIIWLVLSFLGAAYGFKQEYIGFNQHEKDYLNQPDIVSLLFIDGHWRKFSFFSDPVAFAYNMVMPSIFCICLITMRIKLWQRIGLVMLILFFLDASLFSGTRGANVLLPAALVLFGILKYNKQVLVFTCIAAFFLVVLIFMPSSNPNIVRFQTAFRPNNDASYNLRKRNQKAIQPYIVTHPMGGGLGSTGEWGKRFSPGSYLAGFPPDSGYIRVAVEDGPIGLIIFCTFIFVILRTGINNFFLIKDPELKTYCLAMTLIIFAYNLANFPQEALVQFPSNIMFFLEAALINITLRLDIQLKEEKTQSLQNTVQTT
jgi:putative inorganic carbon (HCO3(-)) transporter